MIIVIPAGTKVHVKKGTKYISLVSKKELTVDVIDIKDKKFYFRFPISDRMGWVEKTKF